MPDGDESEIGPDAPDGRTREASGEELVGETWKTLDPRWIIASALTSDIVFGVLIVGGTVPLLIWLGLGLWWNAALAAAAPTLWLVLRRLIRAWLHASYRRTSWRVTALELQIRRGIFWRHVLHVPRSRVQHTDVNQGPLARRYGIADLVVHTAGTSYATVSLEGLPAEIAHEVRDHLLDGDSSDGV